MAATAIQPSTDRKPSARQVYALAHLTLEALGETWPENRAEASDLIGRLRAVTANDSCERGTSDDIPF